MSSLVEHDFNFLHMREIPEGDIIFNFGHSNLGLMEYLCPITERIDLWYRDPETGEKVWLCAPLFCDHLSNTEIFYGGTSERFIDACMEKLLEGYAKHLGVEEERMKERMKEHMNVFQLQRVKEEELMSVDEVAAMFDN